MFKAVPSQIDFPAAEREVLAFWEAHGVYARSLEQRQGKKPFVFFEGPPTANGLPHPGHCLTRAMKDVFPRYKTMTGHYCLRKGGWDTHGLPVEVEVCKELGIHTKEEIEAYGVEAFNRKCLESVFRYTKEWEELTRRLGFWVNLDEAYVTYHQSYVESVWWSLKQLFDAGLLYKDHKIVWWWAQGGTALSAGEVGQGYREVDDPSVVVRFPVVADERLAAFMGSIGVSPVRKGGEKHDPVGVVKTPVTGDLTRRRRILPHWEAGGSTYFLTFRLQEGILSEDDRSLVLDACRHWDSKRFDLHAAVVMPDHVHLLCTPLARPSGQWWSVADLMHSIKGYTAKEINARRGSAGAVWQQEYFDRIIRSKSDFHEKWEYVVSNPRRRGLPEDYAWVWVEGAGDSHWRDADAPRSRASQRLDGGGSHAADSHRRDADAPRSGELDRPEAAGSVAEGRVGGGSEGRISLLVWTTTPWTLPSNMFAAVHRDFDYAVVADEETGERLICAAALVEPIAKKVKKTSWKVVSTCKGRDLVGLRYRPPYEDYHRRPAAEFVGGGDATPLGEYRAALVDGGTEPVAWRVVAADFVTLDAGTGLVHEAPAFGEVDFDVYREERSRFENPESVPLLCAVGPDGAFTDDVAAYAGQWVKACDKDICGELRDRGLLLHQEQYRHDYPFCWRADEDPLIQYPRRSWFIRTTRFKDAMIENNASIRWLPDHIKTGRFGKFLESNVDWSLSRERYWGTPLPIWVCENDACSYQEAVDSYDALTSKPDAAGMEVWEEAKRKSPELSDHLKVHKPYIDAITYRCAKCESGMMRRVPEVIDCWYDSGSMPFAQWGFPHRNREMLARQFPADFISEALDQTRGWFYSLVAISTMLFGKEGVARSEAGGSPTAAPYPLPFRNCIVLGLLMGEDGLKMSKSKKNYKDPAYIFEREGADAMRWLFLSGQAPWTSIRFQESAISEGQREFLIRLYNCYSFFVIYANIDRWTPAQREDAAARSELDRWIASRLDACCLRVYDCMESYDNFGAARALVDFVDGLSNWYVRRNRDRFWGSGMDADKRAAYTTLYDCLVTLCKLIAPFTPFLAESIYQNLVRTHDAEAAVSVHLCDYPVVAESRGKVADRIDGALNEQIAMVRQLVSCGRAARSAAKLRVRQPLAGIELYHGQAEVIRRYEEIVRQELNVKRIDYVSGADIDRYVHYEVKPNFKKIGPKHGPLAPKIKAALAVHSDVDGLVKQLERDQTCVLEVEGRSVELTSDELIVELYAREGWSAERIPGEGILALDTQLTPALRDEGSARDLVNQVQQVRKSLDLRYEQRIDLGIAGDEDMERVVNSFGDTIKGETLAQHVFARPIADIEPVGCQVDGHDVAIYVCPL